MKIIINNRSFTYDIGVRLLKTKYTKCFDESLSDIWEDIVPMELKDILKLENLEDRRIGLDCLGIEKIKEQSNAELLSTKTLDKSLTWINKNGELENKTIKDKYELYTIDPKYLGLPTNSLEKLMFIKCKDTSTEREYLLWIDYYSLMVTMLGYISFTDNNILSKIDALDAVAWTIQTNVPKGKIEEIVRQGDCIMIKTTKDYNNKPISIPRHLTKEEYINLLTLES